MHFLNLQRKLNSHPLPSPEFGIHVDHENESSSADFIAPVGARRSSL
jgi:hypothetical protein